MCNIFMTALCRQILIEKCIPFNTNEKLIKRDGDNNNEAFFSFIL